MACNICESLNDKSKVVYEDDSCFAVLGDSILGHIKVYPKKHTIKAEELKDDEIEHIFATASYAATAVFETLGAQGTNILSSNTGKEEHFCINVLPRNMNDDLNFQWEQKVLQDEEMNDARERIKDKADYIGIEKKKEELIENEEKELKDDYLSRHLERSP